MVKQFNFLEYCSFCHEIYLDDDMNLFKECLGDGYKNIILTSTESFVVMPTIGPLVEGHLLIVPKKHVMSMAYLDYGFDELEDLCLNIRRVLETFYGPVVFFEHGPIEVYRSAGSCVDHAHLHAIPFKGDISKYLEVFPKAKLQNFLEIKGQIDKRVPYLFYEDGAKHRFIYDASNGVPSQLFRYLIARELDTKIEWNWHIEKGRDFILKTINQLTPWPDGVHF